MSVRLYSVVLALLAFQPFPLLGQVSAVDSLISAILHGYESGMQSQWKQLSPNELPPSFRDPTNPINQSVIIGAFESSIAPVMVVFEFQKPQFEELFEFCRSRVNLYQFYRSDVGSDFEDWPSVFLRDFKELVKFSLNDRSECEATSIDGLSKYVLVTDALPDTLLISLWEGYRDFQSNPPGFGCMFSKDAELLELGITRDGAVGERNVPYAIAIDDGEYSIIHFALQDGVVEPLSCDPRVSP